MLRARVIPCLLLNDRVLVKTVRFKKPSYIGDPINTVRIFNELEVDELCFLDIRATLKSRQPNLEILHEIADECFMPLSYGGGIRNFETAQKILSIGFEKVVLNTILFENPEEVKKISEHFGRQSIIGSIDVKKDFFEKYHVYSVDGSKKHKIDPVEWAVALEDLGAGELLVTSMNQEGTWKGYDVDILRKIHNAVEIPVIANGGAGSIDHIGKVINSQSANAIALGSMIVYQAKNKGVLVNFPDRTKLDEALK
ncbi:MAG: imidazole glycerol phosphate synthase subunit HisF [Ekhidna sp.]|nr:imidazole glycerol phosphate synthase subunit HisF [Ekhidna sp.]MBC6411201.1 imidazole glycerol phosphate synthase subunit HisF [Ekhidna sp.]MBC6427488.1 imidazole glycerol phosphate synthase subunit HisF [Ekhidna sp.]